LNTLIAPSPDSLRQKLDLIKSIILEQCAPEKVILLSSPPEEPDHPNPYLDRVTLLVLTSPAPDGHNLQQRIEYYCQRSGLRVNALLHTANHFSTVLAERPYLFAEVDFDAQTLYSKHAISIQRPTYDPVKHLADVEAAIVHWLDMAHAFFRTAMFSHQSGQYKLAAFLLHQAAEFTYITLSLVTTGYRPATHNLDKLRRYTCAVAHSVVNIFPRDTDEERRLFVLLQTAYSDARYRAYHIMPGECTMLMQRVQQLLEVSTDICDHKLKTLRRHAPEK